MRIAYFNKHGRVILIHGGAIPMETPDGTATFLEVPPNANANNIYYDDGLKFKERFNVALSRNLISNIPAGTLVNGIQCNDGSVEFQADVEDVLWVKLDHPHYIYEVVSVETGP